MRVRPRERRAVRPGVPVLLPAALAMWAASAASYTALADAGAALAGGVTALGAAGALAIAAVLACRPAAKPMVVVCFALLGAAVGGSGAYAYAESAASLPSGRQECSFTLASDPAKTDFGMSAEARAVTRQGDCFRVTAYFDEPTEMLSGAAFTAACSFSPVKELAKESSYASGIVGTCGVSGVERSPLEPPAQLVYDLRGRAISLMAEHGGDAAGLMQALVCGYRNTIQESGDYERFKRCGLAHVVAVSGAHLAIVTMAFGCLLSLLRAPRWAVALASAAFSMAYLAFAGVPVSAVRAAVMAVLSLSAGLAKRRSASVNAVALCVVGFLALDPTAAVSVSLFLSAASTLGIVLFAPLVSSWFSGAPRALAKLVGEPVGMTLSSNVATLPFSVALFKQLSLVAPVANVVATPLFTVGCACALACVLLACAVPGVAAPAIAAGAMSVAPLGRAVSLMAGVPYASVALDLPVVPMLALSALAAFALWTAWPALTPRSAMRAGGALAAVSIALAVLAGLPHGSEIVMLDVGQGDAIFVRSKGSSMLVDTGNRDSRLREELAKAGVFHLDAVAVTHPDDDHCSSLSSLFGYVQVDRFLCAADLLSCPCEKCAGLLRTAQAGVGERGVVGLEAGDAVAVGDITMSVVWPRAFTDEGGNADSLCFMAEVDSDADGEADWRALLTGDAECEQLRAMADTGAVCDVDVLKVGHHGSKASLDDETARLLDPELALVSVGASNRYGHPSAEALERLSAVGAKVLRTDERGSVTVSFTKEAIRVQ